MDQETGQQPDSSEELESQEAGASAAPETSEAAQEASQEQPINPMKDALEAFELEKSSSQLPPGHAQAKLAERDFSGLEPNEIEWFKKMSRQTYERLYPVYLEHKKIKPEFEKLKKDYEEAQKTPFYSQEGAWTITPEYKELTQASQRLNFEANHWEKQLEKVEDVLSRLNRGEEVNETWVPLEINDKGQLFYGQPIPITPASRAKISAFLSKAYTLSQNAEHELANYEGSFKSQYQGYVSKFKEAVSSVFEGVDSKKLEAAAKKKLDLFPSFKRNEPEVQALAQALVMIDGLSAVVRQLKAAGTNNTIKSRTAASAGPTKDKVSPGAAPSGTAGAVFDEFKKAKAMGYNM